MPKVNDIAIGIAMMLLGTGLAFYFGKPYIQPVAPDLPARQEQELEKMRLRLEALQADCDRAHELARAWHARAHALRHQPDAALPGRESRPSLPGLEEIET